MRQDRDRNQKQALVTSGDHAPWDLPMGEHPTMLVRKKPDAFRPAAVSGSPAGPGPGQDFLLSEKVAQGFTWGFLRKAVPGY